MKGCDKLDGCPFFHDSLPIMPIMSGLFKRKYCKGDFIDCARYMVSLAKGKEAVPPDLLPHQLERVQKLSL
jgi:hypothetical protein